MKAAAFVLLVTSLTFFTNAAVPNSQALRKAAAARLPKCLPAPKPKPLKGHVTTKNGHFFVGKKSFDFRSFNAPELTQGGTIFEVDDTMKSIAGFGAAVTRTYTLQVTSANIGDADAHIIGWNSETDNWKFNEDRFRQLDIMFDSAHRHGVKVIFPTINQDYGSEETNWAGNNNDLSRMRYGILNYTEAQETVDFFTNTTMIKDFQKIVKYLLNRKNTVNGRRYGDDDTILAWETGNELNTWDKVNNVGRPAPAKWTLTTAATLKKYSPRTLVMDGSFSRTGVPKTSWPVQVLKSPLVDLFSYHAYGNGDLLDQPKFNNYVKAFGKTFVIGEYGFLPTEADYVTALGKAYFDIPGSLIWSLRSHSEKGGFKTHGEGDGVWSFHVPGWNASTLQSKQWDPKEKTVVCATRKASYRINLQKQPPAPIPIAPNAWRQTNNTKNGLTWQGSAWAEHYQIYSVNLKTLKVKKVADHVLDNVDAGTLFIPIEAASPNTVTSTTHKVSYAPGSGQWKDTKWSRRHQTKRSVNHHHQMAERMSPVLNGRALIDLSGTYYAVRGVNEDGRARPFSAPVLFK